MWNNYKSEKIILCSRKWISAWIPYINGCIVGIKQCISLCSELVNFAYKMWRENNWIYKTWSEVWKICKWRMRLKTDEKWTVTRPSFPTPTWKRYPKSVRWHHHLRGHASHKRYNLQCRRVRNKSLQASPAAGIKPRQLAWKVHTLPLGHRSSKVPHFQGITWFSPIPLTLSTQQFITSRGIFCLHRNVQTKVRHLGWIIYWQLRILYPSH